jgi:hypothetical protein
MDWPAEPIPDEDWLFHRVHKTYINLDEIEPAAFNNRPKGRRCRPKGRRYKAAARRGGSHFKRSELTGHFFCEGL